MRFVKFEGQAPRQAHTGIPQGVYEREMGKAGFDGPVSHIYQAHPPTAWLRWEGVLRPRAFTTKRLAGVVPSLWDAPVLARSASFEMRFWRHDTNSALCRNADGDLFLFAHVGGGVIFSDFGSLDFEAGDLVYLPKGTAWRVEPSTVCEWLSIESAQPFGIPDRGLLGQHSPFDPGVLESPKLDERYAKQREQSEWPIMVKRRGQISTVVYPFNPLDTVGWKGSLSVIKLNWRDIRAVASHRYHVPPTAHCAFASASVAICVFTPRPIESSADALKVPFFHSNDDYDEFVFFHSGRFFSRDSAEPGALTFHPAGVPHGPHPQAFRNAEQRAGQIAEEVALNIDVAEPVEIVAPPAMELHEYADSWRGYLEQEVAEAGATMAERAEQ
ncbi:homogentisate 1,2-dioxygenase [Paraburkholderia sp. EG287B]|uniref:homogentisate 1,2-dioxygenase n=1 Tax=Paraburkholderia sp. EG287B TaxID=3237010 RepID=UPI0034D22061